MRTMMTAVPPVTLKVQYRQTPSLGRMTPNLFYEGRVTNDPQLPESLEKEFLLVLWSCSNDMDEGPYPSSAEAELATALWRRLEATTASMKVPPSPFKCNRMGYW